MTMAKATTNGVVPMGVVACSDYIYDAFLMPRQKEQLNYFMATLIQEFQLQLNGVDSNIIEKENIFKRVKNQINQHPYLQHHLQILSALKVLEVTDYLVVSILK